MDLREAVTGLNAHSHVTRETVGAALVVFARGAGARMAVADEP